MRWPRPSLPPLVPPLLDIALALGLLALVELPAADPYRATSGVWWAVLAGLGVAATAWRRRRPRVVWAVTTLVAAGLLATRGADSWEGFSVLVPLAAPVIALWNVSYRAPRRRGRVGLTATLVLLGGGLLINLREPETLLLTAVLVVAAWAQGDGQRSRRQYALAMAERATAAERAVMAGELHEILAQQIAELAEQAGTARLLAEAGQAPEPALLAGLESASRQAVSELRQTLGVPHHHDLPPGLDRLHVLIERLSSAGLTVRIHGFAGGLPAPVDLAAYRVVQEGLTNILRHSRARTAHVEFRRWSDGLTVRVIDGGPRRLSSAPLPTAQGLAGLHERAIARGGWLRAAPRPEGGFELQVHLPLPDPAAQPAPPPVAVEPVEPVAAAPLENVS